MESSDSDSCTMVAFGVSNIKPLDSVTES